MFRLTRPVASFSGTDRQLLQDALTSLESDRALLHEALSALARPPAATGETRWLRRAKQLGGLVAVLSLLFVAWQAYETQASSDAQVKAVRAAAWAGATSFLLQYDQAELQSDPTGTLNPYWYGTRQLSGGTAAQQAKFTDLGLMLMNVMEGYRVLASFLPSDSIDLDAVKQWETGTFGTSPALCELMNKYQQSFGTELVLEAKNSCHGRVK